MHIPLQVTEWVNTEYESLQFRNLPLQLIQQPTNALVKIQLMTSIKLQHVSAPGDILGQFFRAQENKPNTEIYVLHRPCWND